MSHGGNDGVAGPGKSVEFRLRSTSATHYLHNVMTLAGPPVNMADFTTPVRLVRDPSVRPSSDESPDGLDGSDEEGSKVMGRRRRKTRLIQREEDEEQQSLRNQERVPWLLEDFDGQHSYVGQLMTPESRYVIFVNQGNEFRVLLASKWYKFSPKLAYRPLTLEEAEEKMASKGGNEDFDRWLMRKRGGSSGSGSQAASGSNSGIASVLAEGDQRLRVSTRYVNLDEEGFDFQEVVDDDDGEGLYGGRQGENDEEDPTMPRIERSRPAKTLTDAGKQVKKLVKSLDRENYRYESDEEGVDPYAEDAGWLQGSDEEDGKGRSLSAAKAASIKPASQPQRPAEPASIKTAAHTLPRSRSKSPARSGVRDERTAGSSGGSDGRPGVCSPPKSPIAGPVGTAVLTEAEIVAILREAPLKTKDLIGRVKSKLKADPQNKDVFREIVRRIAAVKPSASQDDDKLLELKPEYRQVDGQSSMKQL